VKSSLRIWKNPPKKRYSFYQKRSEGDTNPARSEGLIPWCCNSHCSQRTANNLVEWSSGQLPPRSNGEGHWYNLRNSRIWPELTLQVFSQEVLYRIGITAPSEQHHTLPSWNLVATDMDKGPRHSGCSYNFGEVFLRKGFYVSITPLLHVKSLGGSADMQ
jgi:hypothetical protein